MTNSYSKLLLITLLVIIILLGLLGYLYKIDLDLLERVEEQQTEIDYMKNQIQDLNTKVNHLNDILARIIGSERLEIEKAYASSSDNGWTINLEGVNSGSTDIVIIDITLNGKSLSAYPSYSATIKVGSMSYIYSSGISARIPTNQGFTVTIFIDRGFTSGQTIEIGLVSAFGTVFKRTTVLP